MSRPPVTLVALQIPDRRGEPVSQEACCTIPPDARDRMSRLLLFGLGPHHGTRSTGCADPDRPPYAHPPVPRTGQARLLPPCAVQNWFVSYCRFPPLHPSARFARARTTSQMMPIFLFHLLGCIFPYTLIRALTVLDTSCATVLGDPPEFLVS